MVRGLRQGRMATRSAVKPAKPKLGPAEPLALASPTRVGCVKCGLAGACVTPYLRPFVPAGWTGKLLVVGEAPEQLEDVDTGVPFTDAPGELLRECWREAGLKDQDVARVYALRCKLPAEARATMAQVRACRPFLLRVIAGLKPQHVQAIGATALRALRNDGSDLNLTKARGRDIPIPGLEGVSPKVRVTYDPGAILRGNTHLREKLVADLRGVLEDRGLQLPENGAPEGDVVALDTEWAPDGRLLTVGVASTDAACVAEPGEEAFLGLGACLEGMPPETLAFHGTWRDVDHLVKAWPSVVDPDWLAGKRVLDTSLLARMHDENKGPGGYQLETLLLERFQVPEWKSATHTKKDEPVDASAWPVELRKERCRLDAWATATLASVFHDVAAPKLIELTHRTSAVLHRVSLAGMVVDYPAFEAIRGEYTGKTTALRVGLVDEAHVLVASDLGFGPTGADEFDPDNDGHIRHLVYETLGLPVTTKTKKAGLPSVDTTTLGTLRDAHPVIPMLLDYSKASKIASTWGTWETLMRPFPDLDGVPTRRLHSQINPLGARTGRRSSQDPNFQNVPKLIRGIIRSRFPGGLIGNFDYKSLEVVLIAWLANDTKLFNYFVGGPGYIGVAKELFGAVVQKGTPQYVTTKSIVLGTHYGKGGKGIAETLWRKLDVKLKPRYVDHVEEAKRLRKAYLAKFKGIKRYFEEREHELLTTGQVVSLTGRIRHLPCPDGEQTPGYWHLRNEALNFPVQSLGSDVTGSALIDVEEALLQRSGLSLVDWHKALVANHADPTDLLCAGGVLSNEVHDSLLVDMPPKRATEVTELVVEVMRKVPTLRRMFPAFTVPLEVETHVGPRWGG